MSAFSHVPRVVAESAPSLFGDPNLVLFNTGDPKPPTSSRNGSSGYVGRHRTDVESR